MTRSRKSAEQLIPRVQIPRDELEKLIQQRRAIGLGVIRFSRIIDVSPTAFDNYETGLRRPAVDVLTKWQSALSVIERFRTIA